MIIIKKDHLKALLNAASTDKMRDNINSVHFDTTRKIAEATDGHMLYSFPIEIDGEEKSVIYSSESLSRLLKVYPKEMTHINIKENRCMDIKLTQIDSTYPDTSAVTPSFEKNNFFSISLSSAVLEKLVKIAKDSEREFSKNPGITFSFSENNTNPVIVETSSGSGVIMPCRWPVRERNV